MWRVLNAHPQIVMGNEWFAGRAKHLTRDMFAPERFFSPQIGVDCGYDIHTHEDTRAYVPVARERYASARFIGDKIPFLYKHLGNLAEKFTGATLVWMVRDPLEVAASYKRRQTNPDDPDWASGGVVEAVADFNASIDALRNVPAGLAVVLIQYERFFREGKFSPLARTLNLREDDETLFQSALKETGRHHPKTGALSILTADDLRYVDTHADLEGYRAVKAFHAKCGYGLLPTVWAL